MARTPKKETDLRPLSDRWRGYMQVLLPEFSLSRRKDGGRLLEVAVTEDLLSISGLRGKRQFNKQIKANGPRPRREFEKLLQRFEDDEDLLAYRFRCPEFPLRYANGGVLPIVRLNGKDFFCLFYRDIDPVGWNIANGASDNMEDLCDPGRVIEREFAEELFICEPKRSKKQPGLLYLFEPATEAVPMGFRSTALQAWEKIVPKLATFERLPIPLKWVGGPDRVKFTVDGEDTVTRGYFLSITPADSAIEVDRIVLINVRGDVVFLDGEYVGGEVLDRIVGLFPVEDVRDQLEADQFKPAWFYHTGRKHRTTKLDAEIERYLDHTMRLGKWRRTDHGRQKRKFDLCPITRAIITRYFKWRDQQGEAANVRGRAGKEREILSAGKSGVFVSFREGDRQIALWLHRHLTEKGHDVFCSAQTLAQLGEADYCRAIDRALESAKCLVVVGTTPERFESGWVSYEWRSFINEIHSGRKPGGKVFIFASGVRPDELPFALRSWQMVPYSPSSPHDSFDELERYI